MLLGSAALAQGPGTDPGQALEGLPGFDFSKLTPAAKKELASVLTDEFDYCGRPLTLKASLEKGDACRHTRRLVSLGSMLAAEGAPASEILVTLGRYQQGFVGKRHAFKVDERQCLGPKDARLTVVEFSDFECPFCAAARPLLEELAKKRPDVRLCMAPFPLQAHPNAVVAGQAVLFARDGGKFWEMHDQLFDNQLSLSGPFIEKLVQKLGLDVAAFKKAVAAGRYVDELNASKEAGKAAGVESTPSVYVNGRKHLLGLSPEALTTSLDDELDWLAGKGTWTGT